MLLWSMLEGAMSMLQGEGVGKLPREVMDNLDTVLALHAARTGLRVGCWWFQHTNFGVLPNRWPYAMQ